MTSGWRKRGAGVVDQPELYKQGYMRGYADAMNWKTANHLEHLPTAQPEQNLNCKSTQARLATAWGYVKAQPEQEPKCKTHPDAPHGFVRNASHTQDRYVCECEYWEPPQPEQEPAFYGFMDKNNCCVNICYTPWAAGGPNNKLPTAYYTTPPQRKPLTDEQIEALLVNWPEDGIAFFEFARAIEAAHGIKEKNT